MNTFAVRKSWAWLLPVVALFSLSLPGRCASPEADVKKVVETFYRDYIHFVKSPARGDGDAKLIAWVKASPSLSPGFKKAVEKTLVTARKRDPELGLESDPILAGQDYPDKGYHAKTIKISTNKAAVSMDGGGDFQISLELINIKDQWLIDGIDRIKASSK